MGVKINRTQRNTRPSTQTANTMRQNNEEVEAVDEGLKRHGRMSVPTLAGMVTRQKELRKRMVVKFLTVSRKRKSPRRKVLG